MSRINVRGPIEFRAREVIEETPGLWVLESPGYESPFAYVMIDGAEVVNMGVLADYEDVWDFGANRAMLACFFAGRLCDFGPARERVALCALDMMAQALNRVSALDISL